MTPGHNTIRAATYLRISSDRTGDELGVSRQREDVHALIAARGWTLAGEYVENATSAAGKRRRPRFEALLKAITAGEVDAVVAWALDRLVRTARDRVALVDACRDAGVKVALVRGSDMDPTTPAGRLALGILGEVAQHEIDVKSDRQARAAEQAAQQGRRISGRRPFGYDDGGMTVRADEAAAIRRGYTDLLDGVPLARIARDWNGARLRSGQGSPWRADSVRHVLRSARNAGIRTHRGEEVAPAVWPALVDVETFRAAQALLTDPARFTGGMGRAGQQLLTGVALCALCGATVHGGGARHGKPIYRCSAEAHMQRLRDPVDEWVSEVIVARLSRPDVAELLADDDRPDVEALRDQVRSLRAKLDRIADDYDDGTLDKRQYLRQRDRTTVELAAAEAAQAEAGRGTVLAPFLAAQDAAGVWAALDIDRRRAVVDALAVVRLHPIGRGVRTFRPETVEITWRGAEG